MKVLSFGGGLQTTALSILAAKREVEVDMAIFADPGAEKPETYWYIEYYIKPLLKEAHIPLEIILGECHGKRIYEYCWQHKIFPSIIKRWCTDKFKLTPIKKYLPDDAICMIGFSVDELKRANNPNNKYPLIDLNISSADCVRIIQDYGWPIPVKSACFFCVYARWQEWNWLKIHHPELIEKAVALEARYYERRPEARESIGLFGGMPLWKYISGIQMEMPILEEYSCWSGHCGH